MALWKKPSKFKNTAPDVPKREDYIYDLPIGSLSSGNNGVKCSSSLLAFHIDGEGGKLGVLPTDAKGRKMRQDLTIICAHSDRVADFDFSPFSDSLLATCCVRDEPVKLFNLDINHNIPSSCSNPDGTIPLSDSPCECLTFHPTAKNVLTVAAGHSVFVCDVQKETPVLAVRDFDDKLSGASWNGDGKTLVVISRSQVVSLVDPRSSIQIIGTVSSHAGIGRENRVLYLGDSGRFITSGFTKQKTREIMLFDERSLKTPLTSLQLDSSTGLVIPLYDSDAKLLFLAGKGSTKIQMMELLDNSPFFVEGASYSSADCQTLGACLLPKYSLNVMQAEIDRLYQLTKNRLMPISYKVPRKTFRDFHSDLYPFATGRIPGSASDQWFAGDNKLPPKFSLDPDHKHLFDQPASTINNNNCKAQDKPSGVTSSVRSSTDSPSVATKEKTRFGFQPKPTDAADFPKTENHISPNVLHVNGANVSGGDFSVKSKPVASSDSNNANDNRTPANHNVADTKFSRIEPKTNTMTSSSDTSPNVKSNVSVGRSVSSVGDKTLIAPGNNDDVMHYRRPSPRARLPERSHTIIAGVRQSKYRHVTAAGKDVVYVNLRKVNTRLPLDSNGFCTSPKWAAVPLAGSGGVVAIFDLSKNGKLREGVIPGLENGVNITDLQWCPFDPNVLAVSCENGHVKIWTVPENGVNSILTEPSQVLEAHNDKICCLRYNPVASDVLATAANDCSVIIWDLNSLTARIRLSGHEQPVLTLSWNNQGDKLATVSKDSNLRVFNVHGSEKPKEQNVLQSTKCARVLFVCNDRFLLISSFSKSSDRIITLHDAETLLPIHSKNVDVSSQPLIPYYDNDSSVVFLTGKGDRTIHMYEIIDELPFFMELSQYSSPTAHQAISFCPKYLCDVRKVEFAIGYRLGLTDVERLSFTVPRRRMECFQNDIFPDSLVTWKSLQTSNQWFNNEQVQLEYVSLKPDDMELLYKDQIIEPRPSRPRVTQRQHEDDGAVEKERNHRDDVVDKIEEKPKPPNTVYSSQASAEICIKPSSNATTPVIGKEECDRRVSSESVVVVPADLNIVSSTLRRQDSGTTTLTDETSSVAVSDCHVTKNFANGVHMSTDSGGATNLHIEYDDQATPSFPTKPARGKRFIEPDATPESRMREISESMAQRMDKVEVRTLEQDKMEGVDDTEWEML